MLVTVTFDITTKDQKTILFSDIYLYVDVEVTEEEYEKIGRSCDIGIYKGMYEDRNLSDICDRCREAISEWAFEQEYGDDILFRFDYPLETRIDRAVATSKTDKEFQLPLCKPIPNKVTLIDNKDGTYSIWWPGEEL